MPICLFWSVASLKFVKHERTNEELQRQRAPLAEFFEADIGKIVSHIIGVITKVHCDLRSATVVVQHVQLFQAQSMKC